MSKAVKASKLLSLHSAAALCRFAMLRPTFVAQAPLKHSIPRSSVVFTSWLKLRPWRKQAHDRHCECHQQLNQLSRADENRVQPKDHPGSEKLTRRKPTPHSIVSANFHAEYHNLADAIHCAAH